MTRDEKIHLIDEHYRSFWAGDLDDFDHQLAPDFVDAEAPNSPPGPQAVKAFAAMAREAFGDMTVTIEETVVEGQSVVVHATWRGTNTGSFMGQAPTGRPVEFQAIVMWRLDDQGRIVHRVAHIDRSALMAQLVTP
jgi:predicted ester cyclase